MACNYVSRTRITRTELHQRNSYYDGTLYWGILGSKILRQLIHTGHLKAQVNSDSVANYEIPKCDTYEFIEGRY